MPADLSRTGRLPLIVSAFVYPGAGQFMQRRWVPAVFFSASFTALLLWLLFGVIVPLFRTLQSVLDWASTGADEPLAPISMLNVLIPFLAALLIYLANLADVVRHLRHRQPPPLPPG